MLKRIAVILAVFSSISHAVVSSGTFTIAESGGNYTTLASAEADLATSLISTITFNITGSWTNPDTTAVSFAGCVTFATCPVIIQAIGDARHAGVWSSTAYRQMVTAGNNITLSGIRHIRIDGLQIATTGEAILDANTDAGHQRYITNNIMRGRNDKSTAQRGYNGYNGCTAEKVIFINNMLYGFYTDGYRNYSTTNSTFIVVNNTIVDSGEGGKAYKFEDAYNGGVNLYYVNNIAQEGAYVFPAGMAGGSQLTNLANVSEDATGTTGFRTQQPLFTLKGELTVMNLSLQQTDSTCTNRGNNVSTAPYIASNQATVVLQDIKPQNRQSNPTNWDIGADANIAEPPAVAGYRRRNIQGIKR